MTIVRQIPATEIFIILNCIFCILLNLSQFIDNFLKGRKFKVRLDNTHSSLNPQEEGVPQGSILSPTLFTVKINSIIDALPDDIEKSLYVDDLAVYC